ncbi:MOSC domain-containing protein [Verticiella sediminum]|uniref:MOSC domain-containing protein n=1 Tax=Verticiella sediminum TaxID=1247510 RepID=A0A556B1F7_9BURK|nr:MOSC N-terminal beta barrel domain-containing protein [Verticiella sediminum]TSH99009.1 MOSC domain-containing protein [Verticiella sediminum]
MATVSALYRYPVKGLSPEPLDHVELAAGDGFPLDRRLAITNGGWEYDDAAYKPLRKTFFVVLMQHAALAALRTRIENDGERLVVQAPDGQRLVADLDDPASLNAFSDFLAAYLPDKLPGKPCLVKSERHRFTDVAARGPNYMSAISLVNLASVRALEQASGQRIAPLRFRANVYFDSDTPWIENDWIDRDLAIGDQVRARVLRRTVRCPATEVDPATAERDMDVPGLIHRHFGHRDMGVYVELTEGGVVRAGDGVGVV